MAPYSYVVTDSDEVIGLNTDMPLAPGDERNVQVHPSDPLISAYDRVYGGTNFFLASDEAENIRQNALPYATGASTLPVIPGLPLSPAIAVDEGAPVGWGGFAAFIEAYYGTADLGSVRDSSAALENERSGIRFGTMPRVVLRQIW